MGDIWHVDELFITIRGQRHYLWRDEISVGHSRGQGNIEKDWGGILVETQRRLRKSKNKSVSISRKGGTDEVSQGYDKAD